MRPWEHKQKYFLWSKQDKNIFSEIISSLSASSRWRLCWCPCCWSAPAWAWTNCSRRWWSPPPDTSWSLSAGGRTTRTTLILLPEQPWRSVNSWRHLLSSSLSPLTSSLINSSQTLFRILSNNSRCRCFIIIWRQVPLSSCYRSIKILTSWSHSGEPRETLDCWTLMRMTSSSSLMTSGTSREEWHPRLVTSPASSWSWRCWLLSSRSTSRSTPGTYLSAMILTSVSQLCSRIQNGCQDWLLDTKTVMTSLKLFPAQLWMIILSQEHSADRWSSSSVLRYSSSALAFKVYLCRQKLFCHV